MTQTLKRINRIKRPLNSVPQHFRCLTEVLGGASAIWTLASLMLPKAPEKELKKDDNPLLEAISNYQMLHVQAYVVHVDMVSQHEVAFKLTLDTIEALVDYHRDIYCVDVAANTYAWPEKASQIKKLQEEFVQAANRFVFRTGARALEGLEEDGAGELLDGRSADVRAAIMNMFLPLLPPPPRIVDVVQPMPLLSNNHFPPGTWWQPAQHVTVLPGGLDTWGVLPSTPSPTTTPCSEPPPNFWSNMGVEVVQLPSPTPSSSQPPFTTSAQFYSAPQAISTIPTIPLPSALPCGTSMMSHGVEGFGWSFNSFAPQYAAF